MIRGCGCCPHTVSTDETLAEVARDPRALAVLKSMGIDQRHGDNLSLAEAAAAAEVPLWKLLDALHALRAEPMITPVV